MAQAGISTLGVKLGYCLETTAGTRPTSGYTVLTRVNAIDGISIDSETIDASALEDTVERTVAGRGTTGGKWNVTFNVTDDVLTELTTMITTYSGRSDLTKKMWFEVWSPNRTNAFFVSAQPPLKVPMPEEAQNGLETVQIAFTIEEYAGFATGSEPT